MCEFAIILSKVQGKHFCKRNSDTDNNSFSVAKQLKRHFLVYVNLCKAFTKSDQWYLRKRDMFVTIDVICGLICCKHNTLITLRMQISQLAHDNLFPIFDGQGSILASFEL